MTMFALIGVLASFLTGITAISATEKGKHEIQKFEAGRFTIEIHKVNGFIVIAMLLGCGGEFAAGQVDVVRLAKVDGEYSDQIDNAGGCTPAVENLV